MLKSIIEAVTFANSKGETVYNFGILNAERPFRDSKGKNGEPIQLANGLQFGATNAALLLYILKHRPKELVAALEDYVNCNYTPQAPTASPVAKVEPKVEIPPPAQPVKADPFAAFKAHVAKPAETPTPTPIPAPKVEHPKPAEPSKPILRATYKGRDYRKLPNGVVQFFQGDRADGKDRWVAYTGKLAIDFSDKPGDRPAAPLPQAPKPVEAPKPVAPSVKPSAPTGPTVLFTTEYVQGDTLIVTDHYADGTATWKAHNMAV